ncbi:MAG TPA: MBL fold metallo-hydrolase [Burkholderiales bacterium]|nr:MBL fold metallo-hydrolase [Burkholderiales bacterium]
MQKTFWTNSTLSVRRPNLLAGVMALFIAALTSPVAVAQQPQVLRVANNVYALIGTADTVTRDNRGRVANAGFIVGPYGVVVIDTGVSYRHGKQILDAIRDVTSLPVELVILTHAVREFVFGTAVFEEGGARIAAHSETRDLMKARCAQCLVHLVEDLGKEMDGSRLVLPNVLLDDSRHIRAGGVEIEVLYYGWAATPGDVAILHSESGTLFAGGLVSTNHVPAIRDADFEGWQKALQELLALPLHRVVPGFGPPSDKESIRATAHYLQALDLRARTLYEESASLLEAVDQASIPAFSGWHAYDPNHRRNALHRRLQLEIEDLGGDPSSFALPDGG